MNSFNHTTYVATCLRRRRKVNLYAQHTKMIEIRYVFLAVLGELYCCYLARILNSVFFFKFLTRPQKNFATHTWSACHLSKHFSVFGLQLFRYSNWFLFNFLCRCRSLISIIYIESSTQSLRIQTDFISLQRLCYVYRSYSLMH